MTSKISMHTSPVLSPIQGPQSEVHIQKDAERERSTIEKSKSVAVSYEPSKPHLPSPMWDVLSKIQRLESAADDYNTIKERQINSDLKELDRLHAEESLELDRALAAQKDVTFWTVLQDIGNICMATISSIFGIFTLSTGNPVLGGMLIAAGVTSIANIAFKYGKVWDWMAEKMAGENQELQQSIRTYLPAAIAIACATMSLVATYQVWNLPGLTSTQQTLAMIETAAGLMTGLSGFGQGVASAHLKWHTAEISALHSMGELTRIDLENATEEILEFEKRQSEIKKQASQLVNASNDMIQLINQPV